MPRRVSAPAVAAFWGDSHFPKYFSDFSKITGVYLQQRHRPMNHNEMVEHFGMTMFTGMPHIGKERSVVHGRGTVFVHASSLPIPGATWRGVFTSAR